MVGGWDFILLDQKNACTCCMLPPQESCEFIDSSKPLNVMSLPCRFEMISGMYLGEIVRLILVKKMVVLRGGNSARTLV